MMPAYWPAWRASSGIRATLHKSRAGWATAGRDAGVVLVAEDADGLVVGFARAVPQRFLIIEPFAELAALVVDAAARGRRIGAALLNAVEASARGEGFSIVCVRSNVLRERAHRFYLREGCVESKRQVVFHKQLAADKRQT